MKISVIITVYNLEKYIEQCIKSISSQTYKNIEVIIVDDGSTDKSGSICKEICKFDTRIKYYYKDNGGASSARNYGINKSTGDYIMFVDGDDYLYCDSAIDELVNIIYKNKCNILFFRMSSFYDKKNILKYDNPFNLINENKLYSYKHLKQMVSESRLSISPCDKLIDANILKKSNVRFDEQLKIYEDLDWSFKLYLDESITYSFTNNIIYVYRKQRNNSATYYINSIKILSMFHVIKKWIDYNYKNKTIKEIYHNYLAYQYLILLSFVNHKNCNKDLKKEIFSYKHVLNNNDNYKVKKVYPIYKVLGIRITILILKVYSFVKRIGLIRIGEEKNEN